MEQWGEVLKTGNKKKVRKAIVWASDRGFVQNEMPWPNRETTAQGSPLWETEGHCNTLKTSPGTARVKSTTPINCYVGENQRLRALAVRKLPRQGASLNSALDKAKGFLQSSEPKHHTAMGHMLMPNFFTRKSSKESIAKELCSTWEKHGSC